MRVRLLDLKAQYETIHGIGVSPGTEALPIALMALDVGPGDGFVTWSCSFFATSDVIARLGATLVFVDIDPATYDIAIAQALDAATDRTCAIFPAHFYGSMAEMDAPPALPIYPELTTQQQRVVDEIVAFDCAGA